MFDPFSVYTPGSSWRVVEVDPQGSLSAAEGCGLLGWPEGFEPAGNQDWDVTTGGRVRLPPIYQHVWIGAAYLCIGRLSRSGVLFLPGDGLVFLSPAGAIMRFSPEIAMNPEPDLCVRLEKL